MGIFGLRLPIPLQKSIGTLSLMNSPNPLTSNDLVTRFSIAIPNHCPTPASDRQTASLSRDFRQSSSPCDRPFSGSVFRPCDRPTHGPSDRPNQHLPLPKCNTPSLRRESGKRSGSLPTFQKLIRLPRTSRTFQRYHFRLSRGLLKFAEVLTIQSQQPPGPATLAKRSFIPSCPTPAAGAVA
jgi:hypothetical protein